MKPATRDAIQKAIEDAIQCLAKDVYQSGRVQDAKAILAKALTTLRNDPVEDQQPAECDMDENDNCD